MNNNNDNDNKKQYLILFIIFIFIVMFRRLIIKNIILFLIVFMILLYKYRPKINLVFIIFMILCFSILFKNYKEPFEDCKYNEVLIDLINNIDTSKLYYNYDYDLNYINELSWDIFLLANKDDKLKDVINNKMVEIFRIINTNKGLKNYLIFNNLINIEGYPLFIDHSKEGYGNILLLNEIKILLITSKIFKK